MGRIIGLTGQSGSGKTSLANQLRIDNTVILDGDRMRNRISNELGFSAKDRRAHNLRVAEMTKELEEQGFNVIVSLICPYKDLRDEVQKITGCKFIYLKGGKKHPDYPYEYEHDKIYWQQAK